MTESVPGPVQPTADAVAALRPLPLTATTVADDSLWGTWLRRNAARTLPHCVSQLHAAGAIDNLRRVTGEVDGEFQNMWFADSDVHKTLEAAAWQLALTPEDVELRAFLDTTAALLAKAQDVDGYLNSYYTVAKPEQRGRNCTRATSCTARATSSRPPSPRTARVSGPRSSRSRAGSRI
ncbi:hypothetical protein GCM10018954_088640 [Kutzneria kofuensis]